MMTDSWWTPAVERNLELQNTHAHTSFNKKHKPSSQVFSRLTVVIGPQEHDAGVVIGGACTGGWSYC